MCGERSELVGMRAEGQTSELGDFSRGALGEFGRSIEAGADGGAADGEIVEAVESDSDASAVTVEKTDPAGKFLSKSEGCGVLQVRAPDFYDARKFPGFVVE